MTDFVGKPDPRPRKMCVLCRHHKEDYTSYGSGHFNTHLRSDCMVLLGTPNPINGARIEHGVEAALMRLGPCGLDAKMFEPIPPIPA